MNPDSKHKTIYETLKKLQTFNNSEFPILSIQLGSNEKKSLPLKFYRIQLHSLIKDLDKEKLKTFKKDIEKIESYIGESLDTRGAKSIAFFTAGKHLFQVLHFEFHLTPFCKISNSPELSEILDGLSKNIKYLVLLIDREKAKLFTVHLGNIEEHKDVFGEYVPQTIRQINEAWAREDKILRHIEDHLNRHLKTIAQLTSDFVKDKNIHFIIIGGHKALFEKMKKHLPKNLQNKVLGNFVTELNIPIQDVYNKFQKTTQQNNISVKIQRK